MTKHSRKHYASVTHAVSLWLCRAAVNNGHKYCNQVNVYLTLMLCVIMHKESDIKRVEDVCKVTSHKQAKHRAVSGCTLPWVCSLARVSVVFQSIAVPVFPQDPASFGMREAFPREICAQGCFQAGAGKDGTANSPSAENTHCDGCEVSPRHMGGGTFLPSLPCSCLNWGNLQSGAKLWKSYRKAASSPPPALPAGNKHTTSSSSFCHL